jgi:hypothetical protein
MTDASLQRKRLHGWGLIVVALMLLGIFEALVPALEDLAGVQGHAGWGTDWQSDQTLIVEVVPGSSAARAGVKVGDRFDLDRLFPTRQLYDPVISYHPHPGTRIEMPLTRGSQRLTATITLGSSAISPSSILLLQYLDEIISILILLLGAWIVAQRPTLMTWSLFAFLLGDATDTAYAFSSFGYNVALANSLICGMLRSAAVFVVVFASRVPNDAPAAWRRAFGVAALVLFGVTLFINTYSTVAWSLLGLPARYVLLVPSWLNTAAGISVDVLTLVALAVNYVISRGQDRERMRWVALGVTMLIAADILSQLQLNAIQNIGEFFFEALFTISSFIYLAGILAIAYGIIKGRVVDVTFVLSHAVAASLLAGFIIAAFAVVDWAVGKMLASARLGTLADIGLAIALGFSFSGLHRRVDTVVDRLFFRRRYSAERRLKLAARAVLRAGSTDAIREVLVDEPHEALRLSSAALFESRGASGWRRTRAMGWAEGTLVELADDDLVRNVLAQEAPSRISNAAWAGISLPIGLAKPVLAVPVLAGRRVVAIVLYGQHRSGADIDAEEIAEIERVAEAAGAAFGHVEAEDLHREREAQARRIEELMRRLGPGVSGS